MTCRGCPFFRDDDSGKGYYCKCNGEWVKICDAPREPEPVPSCPWYGVEVDDDEQVSDLSD